MSKQALTKNQQVVFEVLQAANSPMTAYEILDLKQVRAKGLKAPLTIYRALEKLLQDGLAHRIESLNAFIACAHGPHSETTGFMICKQCGSTRELPMQTFEHFLREEASAKHFQLHKVGIEMLGLCESCAKIQ